MSVSRSWSSLLDVGCNHDTSREFEEDSREQREAGGELFAELLQIGEITRQLSSEKLDFKKTFTTS